LAAKQFLLNNVVLTPFDDINHWRRKYILHTLLTLQYRNSVRSL